MPRHVFKSKEVKAAFTLFSFMRERTALDVEEVQQLLVTAMQEAFEAGYVMGQEVMLDSLTEHPLEGYMPPRLVGGTDHGNGSGKI